MGGSVEGSRTRLCFLMSVDNNSFLHLFFVMMMLVSRGEVASVQNGHRDVRHFSGSGLTS